MNLDRRLLREARAVRLFLALAVGAGFLVGALAVAQAYLFSRVVGQVFLREQTLSRVLPLLWGLLAVIGTRAVVSWAGEVAAFRAAGRVKQTLRERLFAHLLTLGPAYLRRERSGELVQTAIDGIEALEAYFSQYLPQLALAALVPLTIAVVLLPTDVLSAVVLLLTAPLIPLFMVLIGKAAEGLTRRQWKQLSLMGAQFLDVLQGLATLKALGRSGRQGETIERVSDEFRQVTLGVLRVAFLSAFALELIATLSTAIVAVEVGLRLLYGRLAFEHALFILVLAPDFYLPLRLLGSRFHAGMSGIAAAQRLFAVLDTPPPVAATPATAPPPAVSCPAVIRFDDVQYRYEAERAPALAGVSLEIRAGEHVALVGPTGAGKSTLVSLLLRFIEPDAGEITVDDVSLRAIPRETWRRILAWVPQHPYLFHETVAENIRRARPDASLEAVRQAATQAHADTFIRALPHGYETVIGERGTRLSGGEAQRLAIARAFLKDAPILILDEATANLDAENEALVRDSIARLMRGRTTLSVAHRLGTIRQADRIVVLDGGRVVEAGAHADLVNGRGVYGRMVEAAS